MSGYSRGPEGSGSSSGNRSSSEAHRGPSYSSRQTSSVSRERGGHGYKKKKRVSGGIPRGGTFGHSFKIKKNPDPTWT